MMSRMKVLIQISSSSMYTTTMMMNKRHVAEQLPGVITFVLIICLAMRFVVLYTWIKSVHKSWLWKRWTAYMIWGGFWLHVYRKSWGEVYWSLSSCNRETADEKASPQYSCEHQKSSFSFSKMAVGSAASQYSRHPEDMFRAGLCLIVCGLHAPLSVLPNPWRGHPWLPQDDRLSYRESLRDSGVSGTWGRLGERASSGRSLSSSSPASLLISGTLGVRVFPLRIIPDWAGTGKLPGSLTRLEEGPPAFMLWKDAQWGEIHF